MEKVRYEIDPFNRLVVTGAGKGLPRQRAVLDGVFKTADDNTLIYHVKSPASEPGTAPHQVKLRGQWSLGKDHNLRFTLDKVARSAGSDSLELAGDIIDVRGNALLFSMTTRRSDGSRTTYVLELLGVWQADKNNRLTFRVRREKSRYDILTFEGAWGIDSDSELIYRYEKSRFVRTTKTVHEIVFKGQWRVGPGSIVSYALDASSDSAFNFKTSAGICGDNFIKYELGVMLGSRLRPTRRTVTLFGTWNIARRTGLSFEVRCANGKTYTINMGAEARITKRDTIALKLKDINTRKDLGLQLELSHALLEGDGAAFLTFLRSREEAAVFVGAGFRW